MNAFFKGVGFVLAIVCLVWVVVLWQWRSTSRDMSVTDIVMYLGVLPLVVITLLVLGRWALRSAAAKQTILKEKAVVAKLSADSLTAALPQDDKQNQGIMHVLAAHVHSTAGLNISDLLEAAAEPALYIQPDNELHDSDGFPVMSARMKELDVQLIDETWEIAITHARTLKPEWQHEEVPSHVKRAIAALAEPLSQAASSLQTYAYAFESQPEELQQKQMMANSVNASAQPKQTATLAQTAPLAKSRHLRILFSWPATWSEFNQAVSLEWAKRHIASCNLPLPLTRLNVQSQVGNGEELLLKADQLMQTLAREELDDVVLVVACDSLLSQEVVDELENSQRLFSSGRNNKGVMPGEAAVVMLLAGAKWKVNIEDGLLPIVLHRPSITKREKSIEAAGRVSSEVLTRTLDDVMQAAKLDKELINLLVSDTDQQSARGTELFGAVLQSLPKIDPGTEMRMLGAVMASTGTASALACVASAYAWAREKQMPCVALTVSDPIWRLAMIARPMQVEAPANPAAQQNQARKP